MHKWIYLVIAGLVIVFIYMVSMPFIMLYQDHIEPTEEVNYYIPEAGLESHYHKEVELAKGKRAREREAQERAEIKSEVDADVKEEMEALKP